MPCGDTHPTAVGTEKWKQGHTAAPAVGGFVFLNFSGPLPSECVLDVLTGISSLHQTGKATSEKGEKQCRKLEPGRNHHMYKPNINDRQNSQPAFKNNRRARHGDAYCSLSTWEVEAGGLLSRAYFGRNRLTYLCLSVTSDFTE